MAISRMRRYAKVITVLVICAAGISGCGRERGTAELPFTWRIMMKRRHCSCRSDTGYGDMRSWRKNVRF